MDNRPTPADTRRLLAAWRRLGHTDESQRDLERVGRRILDRRGCRGYDVALAAWEITRQHLDTEAINALADVKGSARRLRALVKGAHGARRLALRLEQAVEALHDGARRHKFYGRAVVNGRISGPAPRPWSPLPVRRLVDSDPVIATLTGAGFKLPPAGNPNNSRNGALARALREQGITTRETTDILHALGWAVR